MLKMIMKGFFAFLVLSVVFFLALHAHADTKKVVKATKPDYFLVGSPEGSNRYMSFARLPSDNFGKSRWLVRSFKRSTNGEWAMVREEILGRGAQNESSNLPK